MHEFEVIRYAVADGKETSLGRLRGVDCHGAEVLGIEFLGWPERGNVEKAFRGQERPGEMSAWNDDCRYGVVRLGEPVGRPVPGEAGRSER